MIAALLVVGGFGLGFLWFELPSRRARVLIASASGCFALALVLDFIEGLDSDHPLNLYTWLAQSFEWGDWTVYRFRRDVYDTLGHFSKSIEEFAEMLANSLLWLVFLRNLGEIARNLHIRFRD